MGKSPVPLIISGVAVAFLFSGVLSSISLREGIDSKQIDPLGPGHSLRSTIRSHFGSSAVLMCKSVLSPAGGLGALTLMASRVPLAGGSDTALVVRTEQTEEDRGLFYFMMWRMLSYLAVFIAGALVAGYVWEKRGRRPRTPEILTVEQERKGATPLTTERHIAECVRSGHNTKPGRNASSVYITCLDCQLHFSWLKTGAATFMRIPALKFLKIPWDALQLASSTPLTGSTDEAASSSGHRYEGVRARPKQVSRAAAASGAAAASTEEARPRPRPKQATRAARAAVTEDAAAAPEELPADVEVPDDGAVWEESTRTTRRHGGVS